MNNDQENHFSMFKATEKTCDENEALITPITALADVYTQFKAKLTKIQQEVVKQETPITGVAVDKDVIRLDLARYCFVIASLILTYAKRVGNNTLKDAVNIAKRDLERDRDSTLVTDCQRIALKADENIAALAAHGLTPAMVLTLKDKTDAFAAVVADPTHAMDHHIVYTENLRVLMKETNDILREDMDPNMELFSITNPEFYNLYQASRQIIDLHGPGVADPVGNLKGVVRDATTNNVIPGVQIADINSDVATETDGNGAFILPLAPGTYDIRATKDDQYTEQEMTDLVVVNKQDTNVNILLEPLE